MKTACHVVCAATIIALCSAALADRTIGADDYRDRLEGMWLGQLMGNYAGRQVEGMTTVLYEGPDAVSKPITEYNVQWAAVTRGQYYAKGSATLAGDPARWLGDDDTSLEFLYACSLQNVSSLDVSGRTALWQDNLSSSGLYIANRQAWYQINHHGQSADESGSIRYNMQAGWSIDSQITTEALGAVAVGMRRQAASLAGDFGGITNQGYSLHAAQFYAAMYAEAPFATDVGALVDKGLETVPAGSWARDIVTHARQLHAADLADGAASEWLASRNAIIEFAHQCGRDRSWVESASNTGLTTLALLYGQGDFIATVEYGVRGGEDSDCNPATAGGLVGMMKGADAVLAELTAAGHAPSLPGVYNDSATVVLSQSDWTMDDVLDVFQTAGETQIIAGGGGISGVGAERQYSLTDAGTGWDLPDPADVTGPTGPSGLVGQMLAMGGAVDVVVTRNGATIGDDTSQDRGDQVRLIDGQVDLSASGVLPFWTYDGGTAGQVDAYELHFDRQVLFESLRFCEGDIEYAQINSDPAVVEPHGGYFTSLAVQVLQGGSWVDATGLTLSEELDPLAFFQQIEMTFDAVEGSAIRIVGPAGGVRPFTSATEIEVFGIVPWPVPGDANGDGMVDLTDLGILATNWGRTDITGPQFGDFDSSGAVDLTDLGVLATNWGAGAESVPEPTSLSLLALGGAALPRVRRTRKAST